MCWWGNEYWILSFCPNGCTIAHSCAIAQGCRSITILKSCTAAATGLEWDLSLNWSGALSLLNLSEIFYDFFVTFQDQIGMVGRSWRGTQEVKATQTEDLEELGGEVEVEVEDRGRGSKSFLTSKLARLLSFSQWQLVKSYLCILVPYIPPQSCALKKWQVMETRRGGLQFAQESKQKWDNQLDQLTAGGQAGNSELVMNPLPITKHTINTLKQIWMDSSNISNIVEPVVHRYVGIVVPWPNLQFPTAGRR